jgi:hypothetical protein
VVFPNDLCDTVGLRECLDPNRAFDFNPNLARQIEIF